MRTATPEAKLPEFKGHEEAKSAQECARMCADKKCTMAKWNSGTKSVRNFKVIFHKKIIFSAPSRTRSRTVAVRKKWRS